METELVEKKSLAVKEKEERLKLEEELSKIECPYCHKKFSLKKEK
jgi:hypothetical protein